MKKVLFSFLFFSFVILNLWSSPKKFSFKVEGPENSYNNVEIVNFTKNEFFVCKVYYLSDTNGELTTEEEFTCHIKDSGDTFKINDTIKQNKHIGVKLPFENYIHRIRYIDLVSSDMVQICLYDENADLLEDDSPESW